VALMASSQLDTGVPTAHFLDPATGDISTPWRLFLLQLYNRTGGTQGIDAAAGRSAASSITPSASPYRYTASTPGTLYIAGGGVQAVTLQRATRTARIGNFYEGIRMFIGDIVTITYSSAPILNFFPG
jgi:hypothetical protein